MGIILVLNKLKIDKNISAINEQDEIILHLPLTSNDINYLKNNLECCFVYESFCKLSYY